MAGGTTGGGPYERGKAAGGQGPPGSALQRRIERAYRLACRYPRRVVHYTPWLVIRSVPGDLGARPIPVGAMNWVSPDIWVVSSSPLGAVVLGEDNFVHARVFNFGAAPAYPVRVDFYESFATMGIVEEAMNHIGTEWVSVDPQRSVDVRCRAPFRPTGAGRSDDGIESFFTFVVNCTSPPQDPIRHPFEPGLDRHVGMRTVLAFDRGPGRGGGGLAPGGVELPAPFLLNPMPSAGEGRVYARARALSADPSPARPVSPRSLVNEACWHRQEGTKRVVVLDGDLRRGTPESTAARKVERAARELRSTSPSQAPAPPVLRARTAASRPTLRTEVSEVVDRVFVRQPWAKASALLGAASSFARPDPSLGADFLLVQTLTLGPQERRRLQLELDLPTDGAPGDLFVVDLGLQIDGLTVGGCSIVARISGPPPDEYSRQSTRR